MIRSFADRGTEQLFRDGACPARWRSIEAVALRKLDMVDAATRLDDLLSPPGNRLRDILHLHEQWTRGPGSYRANGILNRRDRRSAA